jgi:hypothetical protein
MGELPDGFAVYAEMKGHWADTVRTLMCHLALHPKRALVAHSF